MTNPARTAAIVSQATIEAALPGMSLRRGCRKLPNTNAPIIPTPME